MAPDGAGTTRCWCPLIRCAHQWNDDAMDFKIGVSKKKRDKKSRFFGLFEVDIQWGSVNRNPFGIQQVDIGRHITHSMFNKVRNR